MKLGLISDIHGDPAALEQAWAHLEAMNVDRVVCAGDLVGYGPHPDRVVTFVQERRVLSVRGNHDRWALARGSGTADEFGGGTPSRQTLEFLGTLPFDVLIQDEWRVGVVVHGSPASDMEFVTRRTHPPDVLSGLLGKLKCDFLVVGHTHEPMWYRELGGGLVVNPGSLICLPVVDSSRTFAVVDTGTLDVVFHNVQSGQPIQVEPWT
jgi:putative phosphoesterase